MLTAFVNTHFATLSHIQRSFVNFSAMFLEFFPPAPNRTIFTIVVRSQTIIIVNLKK